MQELEHKGLEREEWVSRSYSSQGCNRIRFLVLFCFVFKESHVVTCMHGLMGTRVQVKTRVY
jgi:hypothetical protein